MKRWMRVVMIALLLGGCGDPTQARSSDLQATIARWTQAVIAGDFAQATTLMSGNTFAWQDKTAASWRVAPWTDAQVVAGPQAWAGAGQAAILRWSRPYPKPDLRVLCTRIVVMDDGTIQADDQYVACPPGQPTR